MSGRQFCQDVQCQGRQAQQRAPSVRIDDMAGHEPLLLQAIEQTRRAMRLQKQPAGNEPDGSVFSWSSTQRQENLMRLGRQSHPALPVLTLKGAMIMAK
jgi:hypothetical protein